MRVFEVTHAQFVEDGDHDHLVFWVEATSEQYLIELLSGNPGRVWGELKAFAIDFISGSVDYRLPTDYAQFMAVVGHRFSDAADKDEFDRFVEDVTAA